MDVLSKPVELIDQDLDAVAGGDVNVNAIIQTIDQDQDSDVFFAFKTDVDQTQTAANVASITSAQVNN